MPYRSLTIAAKTLVEQSLVYIISYAVVDSRKLFRCQC